MRYKWELSCGACNHKQFVSERNFEKCPQCFLGAIKYKPMSVSQKKMFKKGGEVTTGLLPSKKVRTILGLVGLLLVVVVGSIFIASLTGGFRGGQVLLVFLITLLVLGVIFLAIATKFVCCKYVS